MENSSIKVNGTYKKLLASYSKVNGTWKKNEAIFAKENGTWKETWKNAYDTPSALLYPSTIVRGDLINWSTSDITGAAYEWQVQYNGGGWSASSFSTTPSGSYQVSTDISYNSFQMRVRAVDATTHESPSNWMEGLIRTLTPQTLPSPTGLSYPATIARVDKIRIYWNAADVDTVYNLYAVYTDGAGNTTSSGIIYSGKASQTGQTYFDYSVTTDTKNKTIQIQIYGRKQGYYDSIYTKGATVTMNGQKLGTVPSMDVPSVVKGTTVTISWGSVTNAVMYQVEVIYDLQTTYTRVYWNKSRSFNFTFPTDHDYVQFRVKATAPDYTDGDWHYAWSQGVKMQPPPLKSKTWKTTGTFNWRPNYGGQWNANDNYMIQGKWTDSAGTWGNYKSIALFNYQDIRNTLKGTTIEKVQVYFYRISTPHGYYNGQAIDLYTHNYSSHPAGEPSLSYDQGPFSSFALGEGKWVTVNNSVAERIRDGSAAGVALYNPNGANYLKMSSNVQLYVEYR